jgi:hypothetical protein
MSSFLTVSLTLPLPPHEVHTVYSWLFLFFLSKAVAKKGLNKALDDMNEGVKGIWTEGCIEKKIGGKGKCGVCLDRKEEKFAKKTREHIDDE